MLLSTPSHPPPLPPSLSLSPVSCISRYIHERMWRVISIVLLSTPSHPPPPSLSLLCHALVYNYIHERMWRVISIMLLSTPSHPPPPSLSLSLSPVSCISRYIHERMWRVFALCYCLLPPPPPSSLSLSFLNLWFSSTDILSAQCLSSPVCRRRRYYPSSISFSSASFRVLGRWLG